MNIQDSITMLRNIFKQKDYSNLTEMERFTEIRMHKVPQEVYDYIKSFFDNLHIEIVGKYEGNLMDLMEIGVLEGWCWQTTETASLFLPDDSYIERGNLKFASNKLYYHSWINFTYKGKQYIFDPCLQILCERKYYHQIFEVTIKGRVTAKKVKEYFINYISNPPKKERNEEFEKVFRTIFGEPSERTKGEIVIHDEEDPSAPMYRNGVGYKTILDNSKIKKLVAHYYYNDC